MPLLDALFQQSPAEVKKPNLDKLEIRLKELVEMIHKTFARLRVQINELEASLNGQHMGGLLGKLEKRDGRDVTGNDIHLLLSSEKSKHDIRKIREIECKMRMRYNNL